ncbi:hypothetical protein QEJ31_12140 [Pigmentibacter sp. JX0631]|uniref:hypothetical protein n=1 Tax=Pigmentibacter sp. JX0631 TaxID=2976982 RepID=UPI002468EE10|nr:hypothetical protein [Pigmentibacter sp. JX0631]WGL59272.1 hypothetical protein QEJ31_12140 [Pigmentibacter sp. JX0631]
MISTKSKIKYIAIIYSFIFCSTSYAWKNHALITEYAIEKTNILSNKSIVKTESLENFLNTTYAQIPAVLNKVDLWAIDKSQHNNFIYFPVPNDLKFSSVAGDPKIVEKFLVSLRINPTLKFPLYLQILPGEKSKENMVLIDNSEIFLKAIEKEVGEYKFAKLTEGETVNSLAVLATASDEPDYGSDIHLFDDNEKEFNYKFQFGTQPFGNPNFAISSQAPFHMGFYHEASLVYNVAGYLKKTYAEYRIKLYIELSQLAFQSGHAYWGLRFLGWALHYIQDLTQPYHNTPLPGYSTADLIGLNILDKLEGTLYKTNKKLSDTINVVSNRHFILEKLVYDETVLAKENKDYNSVIINYIQNTSLDTNYPHYDDNYVRNILSKQAVKFSKPTYGSYIFWKVNNDISSIIARAFPPEYSIDPKYIFQDSFPALQILNNQPEKQRAQMIDVTCNLMNNAGSHTRNVVKSILDKVNF